jgi:murein DD-endopeptidase MepM/ murein hydrolase activator NlpD
MLLRMRFSSIPALLVLAGFLVGSPTAASAQTPGLTLTPAVIKAGSPVLIRIAAPHAKSIDGEWLGRKLNFFPGRGGWFALAGVDVEDPPGPSTLKISVHLPHGKTRDLSRPIVIHTANYRTEELAVAPQFVEPAPEALPQIKAEQQLKAKVFASTASEPLWSGCFHRPVVARPTSSFGTRRVFNGKLDSVHKGMDFRAATGTPVRAANRGVVVLAQPLYYEGNCVVIDHGLGLFTISMHLSEIAVKEGQTVATGDLLGLSGATGRATGPHLHWAVRWQGAYLDPAKLLRLNLNASH